MPKKNVKRKNNICKELIEDGFELTGSDYSGEVYTKIVGLGNKYKNIIFFDYINNDVTFSDVIKGKSFPAAIPYYLLKICTKRCKEIDKKETDFLNKVNKVSR